MVRTNERNEKKKRCLKIATLVDLCCYCAWGNENHGRKVFGKCCLSNYPIVECRLECVVTEIVGQALNFGWTVCGWFCCCFFYFFVYFGWFYIVHTQMEWGCFCFSIRNCNINQGNSTHDFFFFFCFLLLLLLLSFFSLFWFSVDYHTHSQDVSIDGFYNKKKLHECYEVVYCSLLLLFFRS